MEMHIHAAATHQTMSWRRMIITDARMFVPRRTPRAAHSAVSELSLLSNTLMVAVDELAKSHGCDGG